MIANLLGAWITRSASSQRWMLHCPGKWSVPSKQSGNSQIGHLMDLISFEFAVLGPGNTGVEGRAGGLVGCWVGPGGPTIFTVQQIVTTWSFSPDEGPSMAGPGMSATYQHI